MLALTSGLFACQGSPASDPHTSRAHRILDVTLDAEAPFSTAMLTIDGNGLISYRGERRGRAVVRDSTSLAAEQIDSLAVMIEELGFMTMEDRARVEGDPQDGSTYEITVRMLPAGPPALADAAVHSVRCYEFTCEPAFLTLKNRIVELWGKEFVEAGV